MKSFIFISTFLISLSVFSAPPSYYSSNAMWESLYWQALEQKEAELKVVYEEEKKVIDERKNFELGKLAQKYFSLYGVDTEQAQGAILESYEAEVKALVERYQETYALLEKKHKDYFDLRELAYKKSIVHPDFYGNSELLDRIFSQVKISDSDDFEYKIGEVKWLIVQYNKLRVKLSIERVGLLVFQQTTEQTKKELIRLGKIYNLLIRKVRSLWKDYPFLVKGKNWRDDLEGLTTYTEKTLNDHIIKLEQVESLEVESEVDFKEGFSGIYLSTYYDLDRRYLDKNSELEAAKKWDDERNAQEVARVSQEMKLIKKALQVEQEIYAEAKDRVSKTKKAYIDLKVKYSWPKKLAAKRRAKKSFLAAYANYLKQKELSIEASQVLYDRQKTALVSEAELLKERSQQEQRVNNLEQEVSNLKKELKKYSNKIDEIEAQIHQRIVDDYQRKERDLFEMLYPLEKRPKIEAFSNGYAEFLHNWSYFYRVYREKN